MGGLVGNEKSKLSGFGLGVTYMLTRFRGGFSAAIVVSSALSAPAAFAVTTGTVLFNPYSFGSLGALNVTSGTLNINTGTSTTAPTMSFGSASYVGYINNQNGMAQGAANGIPYVGVFDFSSINIGSGVTVNITGTNGLALLSQSSANIAATLSVSGYSNGINGLGGPGGFAGGNGGIAPTNGQGPGGGQLNGTPGLVYGNLNQALYGGSGGGGSFGVLGFGGGGGGALDITSAAGLTVGEIFATGGGGDAFAGNGSGGAVILSGSTVSYARVQALGAEANGSGGGGSFGGTGSGGGGGGFGGGGRVLIQSTATNQSTSGVFVGNGVVTTEQIAQLEPPSSLSVPSSVGFGQVRTGTTSVQNISFANTSAASISGTYNPTLPSGMSENSGTFSLSGGQTAISAVTFAPISRGTYNGTVSYTSNVANGTIAITGTAVGPVFSTNVGTSPLTVIHVGTTAPGSATTFDLKISNISTDDVNGTNLANLTLESENITGPTASAFYVVPLTQNVLGDAAADSPLANSTDLSIVFNPATSGNFTDYLTITTDQGAPLGDVGQQFTYVLTGDTGGSPTPEPAALTLMGLGALGVMLSRKLQPNRLRD
jgi:hypothetical protein